MNESKLRETIRKEIRESLKEVEVVPGVEQGTDVIDKQPGVKMLKRALGQGSPKQQAAGLIKVINAISGGSNAVKMHLISMLKPKDALEPDSQEPVAEAELGGRTLATKTDRFLNQYATSMSGKSQSQQIEFLHNLITKLNLKGQESVVIRAVRAALSKRER
tara:strand:+ start:833 stop:1318 length:486 start_codon:yes stop_codon:yes gene_type:complete